MAQAILLKDVESLGTAGAVIEVAPGYLRNYLVPRNLAQQADPKVVEEARRRMDEERRAKQDRAEKAGEFVALLKKTVITIPSKVNEEGHLFGSVTEADIAAAIKEARDIKLDKKSILLDEHIRELGTYMIDVEVAPGLIASIKTMVVEQK